MAKPDGGSAFPFHHKYESGDAHESFGLSLRDYFAGQALAGMLAYFGDRNVAGGQVRLPLALAAYGLADAMLAARERE